MTPEAPPSGSRRGESAREGEGRRAYAKLVGKSLQPPADEQLVLAGLDLRVIALHGLGLEADFGQ